MFGVGGGMDRRTLLRNIPGALGLLTLASKAKAAVTPPAFIEHFLRDDLPVGAEPYYDCQGIVYTLCQAPDDIVGLSPIPPGTLLAGGWDTDYERKQHGRFTVPLVRATPSEIERFAREMMESAANWTTGRGPLPGERLQTPEPEYIGRYIIAKDGRVGLLLFNLNMIRWSV